MWGFRYASPDKRTKPMRSVKYLMAAAGAASLFSSSAMAADMPSIMPPPPQQYYAPPPQDFGGWYLRGDVGITAQRATNISNPLDTTLNVTGPSYAGTGLSGAGSYDIGVGYIFNNWLRADLTAEYRNAASLKGSVYGQFSAFGGNFADVDNYSANLSSFVFLANAYVDLGTWWCITPFIGAGVGVAYNHLADFRDDGLTTFNGLTAGTQFAANGDKTSLAWAAHAGLAYHVNQNLTIELAYRYLDLGSAVTGSTNFAYSSPGVLGTHSWTVNDLTSQDLRIGLRWTCCDLPPAAPPPLVRKG
jgi:opacity protein-like surface antigen